jgi:hypothetical protein
MSIYRKTGRVVRWENGTLIRAFERGIAIEDGETFTCHPDSAAEAAAAPPLTDVAVIAKQIQAITTNVERLIVTEGEATHDCDGVQWTERTRRIHLALVRDRQRVLIDQANFDLDEIARITRALERMTAERATPARLRLAPNVAAALLPSLVGIAPPNIRLTQTAGGIDGKGNPIIEAAGDWPNWWRPSYRVRPVRVPMNLRATCDVTILDDTPIAVALLAPVHDLTLRVLVDDGIRSWPATVRVSRIDAIAGSAHFYPYGAGSFGAEMML